MYNGGGVWMGMVTSSFPSDWQCPSKWGEMFYCIFIYI